VSDDEEGNRGGVRPGAAQDPTVYGGQIDHDDDTDIGEMAPVRHEAGTGRDVIAAIMAARLRD